MRLITGKCYSIQIICTTNILVIFSIDGSFLRSIFNLFHKKEVKQV